jgi:beta-glucanase (GH16 family)
MKKIHTIWITALLVIVLAACESNEPPNGLEPLKAYEGCEVPTLDLGYVCTWADEFEGDTLNTQKWNVEINGDGGGNQELQYYTRNNIEVSDGTLKIIARNENFLGKRYTSGRINSRYRGETTYGRIEAAIQMPAGRGTWSAFWMLPTNNLYGGWPHSGEIDIMEHVGYEPNKVHASTHTTKFNHQNNAGALTSTKTLFEATTQLNVYALEWEPGEMRMYVNDELIGRFGYSPAFNQEVPYDDVFPFDNNFHIILNLAIGGNWGGVQGIDDTIFPVEMVVDYVRIYQKDYATLDTEAPQAPTNIRQMSILRRGLFWTPSVDDTHIESYKVYVDGVFYKDTKLNQVTLSTLASGNYDITIKAVDFTGRTSPLSETFRLTI